MKKITLCVILFFLGALCWLIYQKNKTNEPAQSEDQSRQAGALNGETSKGRAAQGTPPSSSQDVKDVKDDLSAQFMNAYGAAESTPENDLQLVAGMLQSYFILVKSKDHPPMGENREFTAALTGNNPYRTRLLSPLSPWLNEQGELVDRWMTPLYFHLISSDQIGVRSAGPDLRMWTSDDLVDGDNAMPLGR